jgi:general L-amino acid transport system substrate-binding protein
LQKVSAFLSAAGESIMRKLLFVSLILSLALLTFPRSLHAQEKTTLEKVRERGSLICGINDQLSGFGFVDKATDKVTGFDADFCRVIAAAVLGKADAVTFLPVATADRFIAIQNNDIDVLIHNTTYTFDRDTKQGADFGPVTFYDGQTVMARVADNLTKLEDLKDASVCAIKGTTTEQNITDAMALINVRFKLITFDDENQVVDAFNTNRCDAVTSDRSQLVSQRAGSKDPAAYNIFEANLSKEPLTPAYKAGDAQWGDIVRWSVYATILAEENGLSSQNVDEMRASSKNPEVLRLLGVEGELYKNLGFDKDWTYNIVKQVGNYGEIYDRNLGKDSPFKLERGLNDLWSKGGLIYAPPYR